MTGEAKTSKEAGGMVEIELDLPKMMTKDIWLNMQFNLYLKLANVIDGMTGESDPRPWLITTLIINTIPNADRREAIIQERDDKTTELLAEIEDPGNEDRAAARNQACLSIIGSVTSYLDQSIGLEERNIVGLP